MADPSTLLLLTCVGCPPAPQPSVQPPVPVCYSSQGQYRDVSPVGNSLPCTSAPERITPERITPARITPERMTSDVLLMARSSESPIRQLLTQPSAPNAVLPINWSNQTNGLTRPPLLQVGSQGQPVSAVQTRLKQLGYNPGAIDAVYGAITRTAVIKFQRDRGLTPDGVVGAETWAALQTPNPQRQPEPQTEPNRDVPAATDSNRNATRPDSTSQDSTSQDSTDPPVSVTESPQPTAHPAHSETSLPLEYLWIIGWAIIYLGGWGFLIKDLIKELAGLSGTKPITRRKDFDAAIQRHTTQKRDAKPIGVRIVSSHQTTSNNTPITTPVTTPVTAPITTPTTSAHSTNGKTAQPAQPQNANHSLNGKTSTEKESMDSELSPSLHSVEPNGKGILANQPLEVTSANQGQVRPLRNVFIELRRASSSNNAQPTTEHRSVAANPQGNGTANLQENSAATTEKTGSQSALDSKSNLQPNPEQNLQPNSEQNSEQNPEVSEDPNTHEMLIALLPPSTEDGEPYTYTLVNDADGLFVLRGNQLRVVNHHLNENETNLSRVITLRRTDTKGSVEKSFKLDIEGIRKLNTSTPELARG